MSCDSRRSLITHPDAISFLRISQKRVFQQTRLFTTIDSSDNGKYGFGHAEARNRCLMCMEGEMHGKVDLLNAHFTGRLHGRRAWPLWLGRSRKRRGALVHQPACVVIRHLSVRTEDVRDNGVLGDCALG